jgi:putative hydrolase of the HAD superfamily
VTLPTVCLFDMDGVIRHYDATRVEEAEKLAGLARGSLVAAAFAVPEYQAGLLGLVSFEDWCAATTTALAAGCGLSSATRAVAYWHESRGYIDHAVLGIVRALRAQARVVVLSNAHDCLRSDLRLLGVDRAFDGVICSAEVHLAKPDPAIYRLAAAGLEVEPSECFFTDDRLENIAAARDVGIAAHLFAGVPGLVAALQARGFDLSARR